MLVAVKTAAKQVVVVRGGTNEHLSPNWEFAAARYWPERDRDRLMMFMFMLMLILKWTDVRSDKSVKIRSTTINILFGLFEASIPVHY